LPPLPHTIDPTWEAKAAARKAKRDAYENQPTVKRMRALQSTPVKDRLTKHEWHEILERYYYRCYYCHGYSKTCLTQDHYIPVSKGGKHVKANIVPACKTCNSRKGDRPADWYNPYCTD
jgi:5-methylcytosine-specific restriction endonuclease McrA